jgi:hypothetical protein
VVSQIALPGCQSPRVGRCSDFRDQALGVVFRCLLGRVFVPMVGNGSSWAGLLLRYGALGLCNR